MAGPAHPAPGIGSSVGGLIILTNSRTLLRSDWIDAPDDVRYAFYAAIYAVWAAALLYSIRQYLANREQERVDAHLAVSASLGVRNMA